jgi:hypothetical protein
MAIAHAQVIRIYWGLCATALPIRNKFSNWNKTAAKPKSVTTYRSWPNSVTNLHARLTLAGFRDQHRVAERPIIPLCIPLSPASQNGALVRLQKANAQEGLKACDFRVEFFPKDCVSGTPIDESDVDF